MMEYGGRRISEEGERVEGEGMVSDLTLAVH